MKSGNKRLVTVICAFCVLALALTGCSAGVKADATVATLNGQEIKLGVAKFYLKYQQAQMETYYKQYIGEDMWNQSTGEEGKTYASSTKEGAMETIETMYLLREHMGDYNVSLSDEETKKIGDAAAAFLEANDKKTLKTMSATQETVEEFMQLYTIQKKMYDPMTADVDTNVSDEEAAQKKISYVFFNKTKTQDAEGNSVDTTDEQKAEIKKQAEEVLAQAKESGDFDAAAQTAEKTVTTGTYGSDDTLYDTLIKEAADQLDEGQFADLIETDTGYYLVRLDSKFDQEATDTKKESIVSQRKSEAYSAKIQEWKDAADFQVDDKVWGKINFDQPLEVKMENALQ